MEQSLGSVREELAGIVQQCADGLLGFDEMYATLTEFAKRVEPDIFETIFGDLLETTNGRVRLYVAYAILGGIVRWNQSQKQAISVLEDGLLEGSLDERLQAAWYLLHTSTVTENAIPALSQLLEAVPEEDYRHLWVAGAIFQVVESEGTHEELHGKAMWLLLKSLRLQDNPDKVFFAAVALSHLQLHVPEVCSRLLEAYGSADETTKVAIIGQLGKIGGGQPTVVKALTLLASSSDLPTSLRLAAIHSLAWVPAGNPDIDATLLEAMQDDECGVVLQAASVFFRREGTLPPMAANLMISYLSHPVPEFRSMAALCLISDPPVLNLAIPFLVQRLDVEDVDEIAAAVASAIGECGEAAIEPLVEAIASASHERLVRYQTALLEASRGCPERVARLIATNNSLVSGVAGWVVGTLGPVAAPAVPILNELLASERTESVQNALVALQAIGAAAVPCTESLIRLLSHEVEEIRIWAKAILLRIGPTIVPSLLEWQESHTDEVVPVLEDILEQLRPFPVQSSEDRGVDGVRNENDLELFHHVAQLLIEHGSLSLRALSGKLQELQGDAGRIRSDLPCSDRQIGLVIDRLEEEWGKQAGQPIRLIDRGTKRKGGLTQDGQRYARLVGIYLERLRTSRNDSR